VLHKLISLYGPCAKGTATAGGDIDIAVGMDEIPGYYLSTMAMLWNWPALLTMHEPVLLTAADDASGFLRTAQRTGIAI